MSRLHRGVIVAILVCAAAGCALAGMGPENVLVVVNKESWASLSVANEYVRQRGIPACNVVAISITCDQRFDDMLSVEELREKVLKPVLAAIKDRGLEDQIDCIAYSADIPTAIDFRHDMTTDPKVLAEDLPSAALTGLTSQYQAVLKKDCPAYTSLTANPYMRLAKQTGEKDASGKPLFDVQDSHGFSGRYSFDGGGKVTSAPAGQRNYLSIVLGITSGRGNSLAEIRECFKRSVSADGTCPKGTFYYMVNSNVRSTTRQWGFESAIAKLKEIGMEGQAVRESGSDPGMPKNRDDVLGCMCGLILINPPASGSKILPGALIENLTSEGGVMKWWSRQTTIGTFIRNGASGASGTVDEPYAIQNKFASPFIFYHYARGCSLVEAYYQSVHGPYQLLMLGEPLCQPWAKIPQVEILFIYRAPQGSAPASSSTRDPQEIAPALPFSHVPQESVLKGQVNLDVNVAQSPSAVTPGSTSASAPAAAKVSRLELFVDGKRISTHTPGRQIPLDTTKLSDGDHELRVVAINDDAIETQGRQVVNIRVANGDRKFTLATADDARKIVYGKPLKLKYSANGLARIDISHLGQVVATVLNPTSRPLPAAGWTGELEVDTLALGLGPARLDASADFGGGKLVLARLDVEVVPPEPVPPVAAPAEPVRELGAILTAEDIDPYVIRDMWSIQVLQRADVRPGKEFKISGYVDVPADDVCQVQVLYGGKIKVKVSGQELPLKETPNWQYFPIALSKGLHQITAEGVATDRRLLEIRFGGSGTQSLGDKHFFHFVPVAASQPTTQKVQR